MYNNDNNINQHYLCITNVLDEDMARYNYRVADISFNVFPNAGASIFIVYTRRLSKIDSCMINDSDTVCFQLFSQMVVCFFSLNGCIFLEELTYHHSKKIYTIPNHDYIQYMLFFL